jgi:plastocyanin
LTPLAASARSVLLALLLASCGAATTAQPVATNQVDLPPSYLFKPSAITVTTGTTVTWTNHDNFTHSVRLIDEGNRVVGVMHPGEATRFTFSKAGTFRYDCSFHPQNMHGTVTVTSG